MRPPVLYPLFAELTSLPGFGAKLAKLAEKLVGGNTLWALLQHVPSGLIDRRYNPSIAAAEPGRIATLVVTPVEHRAPGRLSKAPYRVAAVDEEGSQIEVIFFRASSKWMTEKMPTGKPVVISGKVDAYRGAKQMAHPDVILPVEKLEEALRCEPTYPLTQGLVPARLRGGIDAALQKLPDLPEWADKHLVEQRQWPEWKQAVTAVHYPNGPQDLSPLSKARVRLAYDELLAGQLGLLLVRRANLRKGGRAFIGDGALREALEKALPFTLTGAQMQALSEIYADMQDDTRMMRLLQGDVGSGKTVVALLAAALAAEAGAQTAIMAPTEILARQHYDSIAPLALKVGLRCVVLTGRDKGKGRRELLAQIAEGKAQIVIGTHALFSDDVEYRDLGLAVIDEQHRFGVNDRLRLMEKGNHRVDVLAMTATPIPRTLTLTAYGDMAASRLNEKPPGRKPIDTRILPVDRLTELVPGLERQMAQDNRIYWVCPLVEESEAIDMAAAEERYEALKRIFPDRVGLVHGRMKPAEKDEVMARFASGDLSVLVATTVIEVGVNVPEATIMVIEHAERFGLAQLHQLRGRIGRGDRKSTCILLYAGPLSENAADRLKIIRETEDGFIIAEEDLRLRGAGEILGTRQSGLPKWRIADPAEHGDLLDIARSDARHIIETDPGLKTERGEALKTLLYLYEKDQAIAYMGSG